VKTFEIEIPNDRLKTYKIVTFIILTLNFLGFGYVFLRTSSIQSMVSVFGIICSAVPWLYYLLNKKHLKTPIIEISLISSACIWLYFGNIWMGIMLVVFGIIGFFANKKPAILFSETGISYPSFPVKKYAWADVVQAIWKDDILTIDLKDNKLLQFNIDKAFAEGFNVDGFNNFCKEKTLNS
jgi:hypothetical protein